MSERCVRPLTLPEIREVYRVHIARDFPPDEIKPWARIAALLERERYLCLGLWDGGVMKGYAFYASLPAREEGTDYLLDYFAVLPAWRNQGLGGHCLSLLRAALPEDACVIGEAENPDFASLPEEEDLRRRRLQFYLRNGVADTGVTARVWGVEYRILAFGPRLPRSPEEVRGLYAAFYHSFFPPALYRQKVLIRP